LRSFEQDDRDSIVKNRLSKNDGVEFWFHLVEIEDREDGHGVRSGKGRADGDGFDKGDIQAVEGDASPQVENEAEHDCGDERAGECEG
jgi:hypothetical protein